MNPYKGWACFAAQNKKFPKKKALNCYHPSIDRAATGILDDYFGDDFIFAEMYLDKFANIPHLLEWHLCFRQPKDSIVKRASIITRKMEKLMNNNTKIVICPILEDVASNDEWKYWTKKIRKQTPFPFVRNPLDPPHGVGLKFVGGYYEEHHGPNPLYRKSPNRRIYNPDGCSIDFRDGSRYHTKMTVKKFKQVTSQELFAWAGWTASMQGLDDQHDWNDKKPVDDRDYYITDKAQKKMRRLTK